MIQLRKFTHQFTHLGIGVGCAILLSACANLGGQQVAIADVRAALESLQDQVAQTQAKIDSSSSQMHQTSEALSDQVSALRKQVTELDSHVTATCNTVAVPLPQSQTSDCPDAQAPVVVNSSDKLMLGEVERVAVVEPSFSIDARMDTGASSSSLHATNMVQFERDGKDWVRFDVRTTDDSVTIEKPVRKYVRVFQQADKEGSRRPVVELRIALGNIQAGFEFTLADRSHLEHNMILGRNFLTDIAVVDVSQQFLQPTSRE